MITVLAVFEKPDTSLNEILSTKKYSFNIDGEITKGDVLSTNKYNKNIIVTDLLKHHYIYYNPNEGLKDHATGPKDFKILDISLVGNTAMVQGKIESNIWKK